MRELLFDLTHPVQFWRRAQAGFNECPALAIAALMGIGVALTGLAAVLR